MKSKSSPLGSWLGLLLEVWSLRMILYVICQRFIFHFLRIWICYSIAYSRSARHSLLDIDMVQFQWIYQMDSLSIEIIWIQFIEMRYYLGIKDLRSTGPSKDILDWSSIPHNDARFAFSGSKSMALFNLTKIVSQVYAKRVNQCSQYTCILLCSNMCSCSWYIVPTKSPSLLEAT